MRVWEDVFVLAEDQHGAFTAAQAAEVGADDGWLARARRDRLIDRVLRGGYAVRSLVDEWTPLAAAQLVQPRSVVGYTAGAHLLGFDGVEHWRAEMLVPRGFRARGMVTHETTDLVVPEIIVVDGLRCTDAARTLIDYAAVVDDAHVERALESVLRQRLADADTIADRARALARRGRSGPARALRVLDGRPDTPTDSDLETVYWQALREHGVELPVRQHPVGRYHLDLAYPDIKLFVELDGFGTHGSREAFGYDRRRQNAVVALDWAPLRFTDSDVRSYGRRTAMLTQAEVTRRRRKLAALVGV